MMLQMPEMPNTPASESRDPRDRPSIRSTKAPAAFQKLQTHDAIVITWIRAT